MPAPHGRPNLRSRLHCCHAQEGGPRSPQGHVAALDKNMFRNMIRFYDEELFALRPTPKLEDHLLSAVRDCLFNVFAATLHIGGRSSIRNLRTRHGVVTRTHLYCFISTGNIKGSWLSRERFVVCGAHQIIFRRLNQDGEKSQLHDSYGGFFFGKLERRNRLKALCADGVIRMVLKKHDSIFWSGFTWLSVGKGKGSLGIRYWTYVLHRVLGICVSG